MACRVLEELAVEMPRPRGLVYFWVWDSDLVANRSSYGSVLVAVPPCSVQLQRRGETRLVQGGFTD